MRFLMRKAILIGSVMVSAVALNVYSDETGQGLSSGIVTLRGVMDVALRENPEIQAARQKWEAAKTRIIQGSTPDKPRVDIERMYAPKGRNIISGAEEKNLAVTQEIPFPTTFIFRARLARQEAAMSESAFRAKELEVLSRVKAAYAMLYFSRHAIHMTESNADLMRRFASVAESKYAAGKASQGDVLKAQVELSKMLNMLVTLGQEQETAQAMLNSLLNRPPQSPLGVPQDIEVQPLSQSLEELQARAVKARPEVEEAALAVERGRTALALGRSEYLPDIMLQYRQRNMMNGPDSRDAVAGISLPLWFWKQGAMIREAKAYQQMAAYEYQSMKNMTLFDVKNFLVKVQTARRLVDLYRTSVLPQSEQALKVSGAAYESDRMGFLEFLDAARTLLNFRLEYYQYIATYEQSLADLERAVGGDLQEVQ